MVLFGWCYYFCLLLTAMAKLWFKSFTVSFFFKCFRLLSHGKTIAYWPVKKKIPIIFVFCIFVRQKPTLDRWFSLETSKNIEGFKGFQDSHQEQERKAEYIKKSSTWLWAFIAFKNSPCNDNNFLVFQVDLGTHQWLREVLKGSRYPLENV